MLSPRCALADLIVEQNLAGIDASVLAFMLSLYCTEMHMMHNMALCVKNDVIHKTGSIPQQI